MPVVPLLSVSRLNKRFANQQVLHDISFEVLPGEIHALVGENGCGKSTFIKCLAGVYEPEPGAEIRVMGVAMPVPFTAASAGSKGLSFIHQNLGLIPTQSVTENLALSRGFTTAPGWRIRWNAERDRAVEALKDFGDHIDPDELVANLPQADRCLVAIARGLQTSKAHPGVLVLDEPTAALPSEQVAHLFTMLRAIAARGTGIIYVSHRLNEILELADRVTAFRDGRHVGTCTTEGLSESQLVEIIIGRSIDDYYPDSEREHASDLVMQACGLSGKRVDQVDLDLCRGEIVGVAGLLGSGRSELTRLLFGAQLLTGGGLLLDGKQVTFNSPSDALAAGLGYVPQDRLGQGGVGRMTVGENITLSRLGDFWRKGRLRKDEERRAVGGLVRRFKVRPPDQDAVFSTLSGGNQQKCIVARALRTGSKVLVLDEPTQGVDIGSKTEIYGFISDAASQGAAVLLIDSDFEDLCHLCDRVLVIKDGRFVAELKGGQMTPDRISELVYFSESGTS